MSVATKLLAVDAGKQSIKTALEAKGVDTSSMPFTEYGDGVTSIPVSTSPINDTQSREVTLAENVLTGDMVYEYPFYGASGISYLNNGTNDFLADISIDGFTISKIRYGLFNDGDSFVACADQNVTPAFYRYDFDSMDNTFKRTGSPALNVNGLKGYIVDFISVSNDGSKLLVCWNSGGAFTYDWNTTNNRYENETQIVSGYVYRGQISYDGSTLVTVGQTTPYTRTFKHNGSAWVQTAAPEVQPATGYNSPTGKAPKFSQNGDVLLLTEQRISNVSDYPYVMNWVAANNRYELLGGGTEGSGIDELGIAPTETVYTSDMSLDGLRIILGWSSAMSSINVRTYSRANTSSLFTNTNDLFATSTDLLTASVALSAMSPDGLNCAIFIYATPYVILFSWNQALNRFEETTNLSTYLLGYLTTEVPLQWKGDTLMMTSEDSTYTLNSAQLQAFRASAPTITAYHIKNLDSPIEIPEVATAIGYLATGGVINDVKQLEAVWWEDDRV